MATTTTPPTGAGSNPPGRKPGVAPIRPRPASSGPLIVRFYRSAVGKKWVMAVTGVILMGFVLAHLIGNLKLYLSKEEINLYGEALRNMPGHLLPRTVLLWTIRDRADPRVRVPHPLGDRAHAHQPQGPARGSQLPVEARLRRRRLRVAHHAVDRHHHLARSSIFHLMDLTWGNANSHFLRGDPYNNLVYSMRRPAIAAVYIFANMALALHLYHGVWSMFQSMGITNPRYNSLRRRFAQGFAAVILVGNVSFPVAVQLHAGRSEVPGTKPPTAACPAGSSATD